MDQIGGLLRELEQSLAPLIAKAMQGAWTDPVAMPLWLALGGGALLVLFVLRWLFGGGSYDGAGGGRLRRFVVLAVLGVAVWQGLKYVEDGQRQAVRVAMQERVDRALATPADSNPVLGCVTGATTSELRAACERTLFGKAENAASAVSLVKDRVDLLAVAADAKAGLGPEDASTVRLRRLLEADEFGVVAHVLATTGNCTVDACPRLALLKEQAKVREHLAAKTFEGLIEKHSQEWAGAPKRNGEAEAAAAGGAASLSVGAVEQPTVQPGAPTLWAVPQAGDAQAPPPAPVAAPAAAPAPAPTSAPITRPAQPAARPATSNNSASGTSGTAPPAANPTRAPGVASGGGSGGAGSNSSAPRPQASAPPPVRAGGLPPPQSLAPPPGTPAAPGVPPRVN